MNTKRVNTVASVILAALTQNRTAAGIALALESAGMLAMQSSPDDALAKARNEAWRELRRDTGTSRPMWRTVITDSESPTGFAPVCSGERSDALHMIDDYPGGPQRDEDGVYDCCPYPQVDTYSTVWAEYLVGLLNADASDELTGAYLARWEEEQDNARLRLALKSAQHGRRELRARLAGELRSPLAWARLLDAKSVDNFLMALGMAVDTDPVDGALSQAEEMIRSFRSALPAGVEEEREQTLHDHIVARDGEIERLKARVAELEAGRAALAARLRAGQVWQQGRSMPLVSQDYVPQDELRTMFGIPLVAPWDEDPCLPCGCPKRFDRHADGCPVNAEADE